jgi:benzoyl-CoA reductase/2-hydroxyglutaryl-CoA dehydratase subunit BcrC/BadD/HgdB
MPRLHAQVRLKEILRDYFTDMQAPIAWCTSAGPAEILRALGFEVYVPENHGAMLGASRLAGKYIPQAHQAGYSTEICSYLTADIGAHLAGETPLTEAYGLPSIPRPDIIVFCTNQCREVADWFTYFAKEFNCPALGIFPPRYLDEISNSHIDDMASQLSHLISVAEQIIGKPLDPKRLSEAVRLSRAGSDLWKQVLQTAKNLPAPLTFWDGTILMAPIVMLRGTQVCVDFYSELLDELKALTAKHEGAVPGEQIRIYWEGMPIWGRLRSLSQLFEENQAAVVASTYCNSWIFDDFNPDDPLRSMAYAYTQIFINRGEETKMNVLRELLEEYAVDGIIYHDSKTCFNNANCRFALPERLQKATGIPSMTLDGDLNDLRFFSDGQARTRLETFIEQLIMRK